MAGKKNDPYFMQCKTALATIKAKKPGIEVVELSYFETEWEEYLKRIQKTLGGRFMYHRKSPLIFLNSSEYIGADQEFLVWAEEHFDYHDTTKIVFYNKRCQELLRKTMTENPARKYCYMDLKLDKELPATVIFELFMDIAPLTCNNFIELCKGFTSKKKKTIGYKGSMIHRVVPQIFAQGGIIDKSICNGF